jgi:hypothetical protein
MVQFEFVTDNFIPLIRMAVINYALGVQPIRLTGLKNLGKGSKNWKLNRDMKDENAFCIICARNKYTYN